MLELYHHDTSVCASKVRFAIAEKRLDCTLHFVDLLAGEQHQPEYRQLNPKSVVPTLVHDGNVIIESNVICEYLEDAFPNDVSLRPTTPLGCASMRAWMRRLDEEIHELTSVISFALSFRHSIPDEKRDNYADRIPNPLRRERIRDSIHRGIETPHFLAALRSIQKLLDDMETALAQSDWLAGDKLSLADIALAPYITRFEHLQWGFLWKTRPSVQRWFGDIRSRKAYRSSHEEWFENNKAVQQMQARGTEALERVKELAAT